MIDIWSLISFSGLLEKMAERMAGDNLLEGGNER